MKKKQKKVGYPFLGAILLILIFFIIIQIINLPKTIPSTTQDLKNFTSCLNKNNVRMYGSIKNINSVSQMEMFGSSLENLNYIDCSERNENCREILILPSWKIDNKLIHGAVSLEVLSKLTECEL